MGVFFCMFAFMAYNVKFKANEMEEFMRASSMDEGSRRGPPLCQVYKGCCFIPDKVGMEADGITEDPDDDDDADNWPAKPEAISFLGAPPFDCPLNNAISLVCPGDLPDGKRKGKKILSPVFKYGKKGCESYDAFIDEYALWVHSKVTKMLICLGMVCTFFFFGCFGGLLDLIVYRITGQSRLFGGDGDNLKGSNAQKADQLKALKKLDRAQKTGAITPEEFEEQKRMMVKDLERAERKIDKQLKTFNRKFGGDGTDASDMGSRL